jgi:manganese efflux pump family protein
MPVAALITWIVTAGLGFFMLGTWLREGGARADAAASHFRPPVVFGHFLLAAGGLVIWIVYVLNTNQTLAWIAFVDLLVVAGLGDLLVLRRAKDRRGESGGTASRARGRGAEPGGTATVTGAAPGTMLAEQRIPPAAVIVHGIFAVTTVVLVLLSALGVGVS